MKLAAILLLALVCAGSSAWAGNDGSDLPSTPMMREELSPEQVDKLLALISHTMRELSSLKADFTQERHMAAFEDTLVAKGTMYFKAPDKIRWELSEPYRSALVFDGERIAKFIYGEGGRRRLKMGSPEIMQAVLRFIALWTKGDFESSRELFDLQIERVCAATSDSRMDRTDEKSCDFSLRFTPRSAKMMDRIRCIELAMDNDTKHIDRVTIHESQGDHILIRFANRECSLKFAKDLFALN